jgi:hypothetical protein
VTQHGQQQTQHTGVFYAEDHTAIRWPYYLHSVLWPLVLVVTIAAAAVTGNPDWALPIAAGIAGTLLGTGFTVKMWPVGIRAGGDGIRIGAVRGRARARNSPPWADYQRRQVLFCPWDAVRRAAVITGKPALRDARSLSRQGVIRLGVLPAPFMRGARGERAIAQAGAGWHGGKSGSSLWARHEGRGAWATCLRVVVDEHRLEQDEADLPGAFQDRRGSHGADLGRTPGVSTGIYL